VQVDTLTPFSKCAWLRSLNLNFDKLLSRFGSFSNCAHTAWAQFACATIAWSVAITAVLQVADAVVSAAVGQVVEVDGQGGGEEVTQPIQPQRGFIRRQDSGEE